MSDAAEALRRMRQQLIEAPEDKFIEVVRVLEQAGDRPEVRQTIQSIRPRLAQLRPKRRMTLKRIFCDPFEDMLEARLPQDAPVGAIPRRFIDPVWREVSKRADTRHMTPLEQAVKHLDSDDHAARHALGCRLWYASTQALQKLLEEAPAALGLETLNAARDILQFVEIGHQIASLKNALPNKPIPSLDAEDVKLIEAAVQETARLSPAKPFYLLLTVASRMRRPADLLAAMQDMDFGKARREKPSVFASLAGMMVDALEGVGQRLDNEGAAQETPPADPAAAVAVAERLVESLEAAQSLLTGVGDVRYDERLKKVRAAVQDMVRRDVLAPAKAQIAPALPAPPPSGAPLAPPDDAKQESAEGCARAMRRCERFAGALALAPDVAQTLNEISRNVEREVAQWAAKLQERGAGGGEEDEEAAILSLSYAVRILELTAGASRADALFQSALSALQGEQLPTRA